MSKGGWARLKKQQQQQPERTHTLQNTSHSITPPLDHASNSVRASTLLRIARQWKALSTKCRSSTTSSARSMLNFVPPTCFSPSRFQLSTSDQEDEGESASDADNPPSSTCSRSPHIPFLLPIQNKQTESAEAQKAAHYLSQPQYAGKKRVDSTYASEVWASPRRASSCPKLIKSPLRSCTPSPLCTRSDQQEEESESLQGGAAVLGRQRGDRRKLRRSSSSPGKGHSTVPKGYLALYVGKERERFLVKASVVNHPMFGVLLQKAKDEFGFDQKGGLHIPCDIAFFQRIMLLVEPYDDKS